jgi:DNA-binding FrmR family transcriptional regulator
MIANDRYCDDVLIQLSAVDKSIKSWANLVLDKHMHSCLIENIKNDNYEVIDEIVDLFKRFQ